MSVNGLLQWQWEGYRRYHQVRASLLLHIVAVPVFIVASIALIGALISGRLILALIMLGLMALSMAVQGRGHRLEPVSPEPFSGAGNAIARIVLEQWITFPRFVLSGGWMLALRKQNAPR